jgi:type IV pilus assembly protein PilY1
MLGHVARLALAALALGAAPAAAEPDDDLFLFTGNYPPNVVLLQDNSLSMAEIEWHPAFDPEATPTCSFWDNTKSYTVSNGTLVGGLTSNPLKVPAGSQTLTAAQTADTDCHNTRTIYNPNNPDPTTYSGRYLNWYFSDEADAHKTEIETAVHVPPSCNTPACTSCDDKYRRTRNQMAMQVLLDVLCLAEPSGIRFGHAFYREGANAPDDDDPNGGWVGLQVDHPTPGHASNLEAHIKNIDPDFEGTPLAETLFTVYTYYMSRVDADRPNGADGATKFPKYVFRESTGAASTNNVPDSPVESACQKNFVIIVTSGKPTRDDFDVEANVTTAVGFADFQDLIGDYHADSETEEDGDADETAWYLDDVAKYMHDNDFHLDFDDDQTVDIYTVGLNVDSTTNGFLKKTSEEVGGGLNYYVRDGDELAAALLDALNSILEKAQSFTAATVPSSRTADGGDFFTTYFLPSGKRAFWEGSLRAWHIEANGDITDANGDCALVDPDAGECNSGPFDDFAVPFWEAADEMPLPADRELYVSKLVSGTPDAVAFDVSLDAADLGVQTFATPGSPPDPSPNSSLYTFRGSLAINEEGLTDEIVQFTRGCTFGTGVETADIDGGGVACAPRNWRLGDIFHSNPLLVGFPKTLVSDASFVQYKADFATRKRVMYTGANDGFVHAFDAGDWDASATPPKYDIGTGVELFGFMPWEPRQNIRKQIIDPPTDRTYYVDGSPQAADVWLYPTAGTLVKDEADWRTVLVGGLRQGGRHYYALDITDPSGTTYPYPGYLWEFPNENDPDDPSDADSYLPWMGDTWGQPIITRVRVEYDGDTVERWVAVVTAGYSAEGDPNNASYSATSLKGRGIFLIDVKSGQVLAEHKFDDDGNCPWGTYDATAPDEFMCFALASTPAVFDVDFDGFADVIYVGDAGGSVWKWAIHDVGEDRVNDGTGLKTQPAWEFGRFFRAPRATISGDTYYKSFFTTPAGALDGGQLYVTLGTGERTNLGFEGVTSNTAENNRFYVLIDSDPYENVAGIPAQEETDTDGAGPLQALTNVTSSTTCSAINPPGYFFTVGDGEKFVTRTDIFAGYVIGATFAPDATAVDPCVAKGVSALYAFRLSCGQGYFTDGGGDPDRNIDIGAGFPTDPQTSLGVGGTENRIYIQKSGSDLQSIEASDVEASGRLLYWREMP